MQNTNIKCKIQHTGCKMQYAKCKIQNTQYKIQNTKYKINDFFKAEFFSVEKIQLWKIWANIIDKTCLCSC